MRLGQSYLSQPIWLLILAIALYGLWQIRQLLLLIFAAIVLAQALHLQAKALQRSGIQRPWNKPLSLVLFLAISVGFIWLIVPPVLLQLQQLAYVLPQGLRELGLWLADFSRRLPIPDLEEQLNLVQILSQLQPLLLEILGKPLMFVSVPLAVALNLLIILVLAVMFWVNPRSYRRALIRLFPRFYRLRIYEILDRSAQVLERWLTRIVLQMLTVALCCGFGLWLLGVRFALAQGVLAGLLTFIPYLGPVVSVIPPLLTRLERWDTAIAILVLYTGVHWGIVGHGLSYWFKPAHRLLPGIALLMEILFARLFGLSGLILAFPLTLVGQVWVQAILIQDILNHWQGRYPPNLSAAVSGSTPSGADSLYPDPQPQPSTALEAVPDEQSSVEPQPSLRPSSPTDVADPHHEDA